VLPEDEDDELGVHPDIRYTGPAFVYAQVADHIEERIRSGDLGVDEQLPPERELADQYRVAYMTIRRAMQELRARGTISTIHGRGTFVVKVPPKKR
jgi:GntR family transcriptional regulator